MMGETQIISIIIPCYNNSQELAKTLNSIANLEVPNNLQLHLVIVDGSEKPLVDRNNVSDIIQINTSSPLTLTEYIHGQDKGPYDAMNKGLRVVNRESDWIWFLNSGDCALKLPNITTLNSGRELIVGSWKATKSQKISTPSRYLGLTMSNSSEIGYGLCHQAMLFNYANFKFKAYNYQEFPLAAELNYYIESIIKNKYIVDESFVCLYDNKKGLSQSKELQHIAEQSKVFKNYNLAWSKRRKIMRIAKALIKKVVDP